MRLIKLLVIAGGAYVLGAKAGHERYEEIMDGAKNLWNSKMGRDARSKDDEIIVED